MTRNTGAALDGTSGTAVTWITEASLEWIWQGNMWASWSWQEPVGNVGIRDYWGCVDRKLWYCSDQDKTFWKCNVCMKRTFQAGTENCEARADMKGYLRKEPLLCLWHGPLWPQMVLGQRRLIPLRWDFCSDHDKDLLDLVIHGRKFRDCSAFQAATWVRTDFPKQVILQAVKFFTSNHSSICNHMQRR